MMMIYIVFNTMYDVTIFKMLKMSLAQVKQQRQEGDFETFQMKEIE